MRLKNEKSLTFMVPAPNQANKLVPNITIFCRAAAVVFPLPSSPGKGK